MKLEIHNSNAVLTGPEDICLKVHKSLSYVNRAISYQIFRMSKSPALRQGQPWAVNKMNELRAQQTVFCGKLSAGAYTFPVGLVPRVEKELREYNYERQDSRVLPENRRIMKGPGWRNLRKSQQAVMDLVTTGNIPLGSMGLINLATGVGKTILAANIIKHLGVRTLFMVPTISILKQTVKNFERLFGTKNVRAYGGGKKSVGYITVGTYQSVNLSEPETFDEVDLVVNDESHHIGAETFASAAQRARRAFYRFGLSATPERADGGDLLVEGGAGPVIYEYTTAQAIADGVLARPSFTVYDVYETAGTYNTYKTIKKKRVRTGSQKCSKYSGPDADEAYKNWILGNDRLNQFVSSLASEMAGNDLSVLILIDEKEHADKLLELMPGAGYAYGGNKENEALQEAFNKRQLRILLGTSTIGEGTDLPPVNLLINLSGGSGGASTQQAIGRALRNEEDENGVAQKPTVMIVDFSFPESNPLKKQSQGRQRLFKTLGEVTKMKLNLE